MAIETSPLQRIRINVIHEPAVVPMTPRKRDICLNFGIPPRESPHVIAENLDVHLGAGRIILLSGPSGSGKSSVLRHLSDQLDKPLWVGRSAFPANRPLIDAVAPREKLSVALEVLTACGLGEPRLWVRRYCDLSDGEKFRASLARAIGAALCNPSPGAILCDEFTAILHRRAARAIAHNLRKLVTRHGLTLIVATTHDDITSDLQPDETVRLGGMQPELLAHIPKDRVVSLRRGACIERGSVRDYRTFSPMHYRNRDGLGFVDKVFLLREAPGKDPLGILVFAHAPRELALRNRATEGRFTRNMRRLNRELRILRRLVMHPDVRGCGLGHWFVQNTLPLVGVRFIECLAVMGAVNPVFEKAGMTRIGRCALPPGRMKLLERMREMKLDPFAPDFHRTIGRYPRVRELVKKTIRDWVAAMHSGNRYDVECRTPIELSRAFRQLIGDPPMYYLWDRDEEYPGRAMDPADLEPTGPSHGDRANPHEPQRAKRDRGTDRHHPAGDGSVKPKRRSRELE